MVVMVVVVMMVYLWCQRHVLHHLQVLPVPNMLVVSNRRLGPRACLACVLPCTGRPLLPCLLLIPLRSRSRPLSGVVSRLRVPRGSCASREHPPTPLGLLPLQCPASPACVCNATL